MRSKVNTVNCQVAGGEDLNMIMKTFVFSSVSMNVISPLNGGRMTVQLKTYRK
jgi:hypothetical protein